MLLLLLLRLLHDEPAFFFRESSKKFFTDSVLIKLWFCLLVRLLLLGLQTSHIILSISLSIDRIRLLILLLPLLLLLTPLFHCCSMLGKLRLYGLKYCLSHFFRKLKQDTRLYVIRNEERVWEAKSLWFLLFL